MHAPAHGMSRNCCVSERERERERERESVQMGTWPCHFYFAPRRKIEVCGTFLWAEGIYGAVIHTDAVCSVAAMLIAREMWTGGRKCPRKSGRSAVDAERLARDSRPRGDDKLEESRGLFLEYGRITIAGSASGLNSSRGSGYLAGYSSAGHHEVCTEEGAHSWCSHLDACSCHWVR